MTEPGRRRDVRGERILVPVSDTLTLRATVGYAVESALQATDPPDVASLRFVYIHSLRDEEEEEGEGRHEEARELLSRVTVWAEEDAGDHTAEIEIETTDVGGDEYIFSPRDVAALLETEMEDHGTDRIVLDPEYDPGIGSPMLRPLEVELAQATDVEVEEAPVERQTRRVPLVRQGTAAGFGALLGLSFVFFQVLGGNFDLFDLVTGTMSATIVAVALSRVSLNRSPGARSFVRLGRALIYVPYLLYEIVVANVLVAAVILNPKMPIDPRMTQIRARLTGPLPVTTLANSITLTPGTLTVRVRGQDLVVHTLIPAARDGLFDGALERWCRFVFYGRTSMAIASPRERGDTEILQQPDDGEADEDTEDGEEIEEDADGGNQS